LGAPPSLKNIKYSTPECAIKNKFKFCLLPGVVDNTGN